MLVHSQWTSYSQGVGFSARQREVLTSLDPGFLIVWILPAWIGWSQEVRPHVGGEPG